MLLSYSIHVLFIIKIKYIKLRIIYYYSIFIWLQKFDIYYETATVEPDKKRFIGKWSICKYFL